MVYHNLNNNFRDIFDINSIGVRSRLISIEFEEGFNGSNNGEEDNEEDAVAVWYGNKAPEFVGSIKCNILPVFGIVDTAGIGVDRVTGVNEEVEERVITFVGLFIFAGGNDEGFGISFEGTNGFDTFSCVNFSNNSATDANGVWISCVDDAGITELTVVICIFDVFVDIDFTFSILISLSDGFGTGMDGGGKNRIDTGTNR